MRHGRTRCAVCVGVLVCTCVHIVCVCVYVCVCVCVCVSLSLHHNSTTPLTQSLWPSPPWRRTEGHSTTLSQSPDSAAGGQQWRGFCAEGPWYYFEVFLSTTACLHRFSTTGNRQARQAIYACDRLPLATGIIYACGHPLVEHRGPQKWESFQDGSGAQFEKISPDKDWMAISWQLAELLSRAPSHRGTVIVRRMPPTTISLAIPSSRPSRLNASASPSPAPCLADLEARLQSAYNELACHFGTGHAIQVRTCCPPSGSVDVDHDDAPRRQLMMASGPCTHAVDDDIWSMRTCN